MAGEPELKTVTKQKIISPLMIAWSFVVVFLSLTVAWVILSEDPDHTSAAAPNAVLPVTSTDVATPDENGTVALEIPENTTNTDISQSDIPSEVSSIPAVNSEPLTASINKPVTIPSSAPQNPTLTQTQQPLKTAPNPNLLVRGENGMKPALGPDGLIAWKEYARPHAGDEETPRIAILITDIGLSTRNSNAAINDLPGQIDMAFSPYGRNLQSWMDKARAKGHEGFLMVPTEPMNYPDNDPGPHTLIADFSARDNLLRLDWILSQVSGYVGVINHMGSKFTASEEALEPVLQDLNNRGLMLLDARSSRFSMAARVARRIGMPRAMNDRYIDNVTTADEIRKQLTELENTATTFGAAVGLARATPLSINELAAWAETLTEKGIALVPITAVANRQPIK